jgi:hypothetical protein
MEQQIHLLALQFQNRSDIRPGWSALPDLEAYRFQDNGRILLAF